MLILLFVNTIIATVMTDPASDQLPIFKKKHPHPIGILTTNNGAPVEVSEITTLNSPLLSNDYMMQTFSHLVRENIPDRIFHSKGAAAFGYFVVKNNISDICKANLFSEDGKKTSVVVRFSQAIPTKGIRDTLIGARGCAIKFYTEEGNFDIVGLHTPMFSLKDPANIDSLGAALKPNPVTNLVDANIFWDILTLRPETMNAFLFFFGDQGVPDGYRHMPIFGIHTYQVYNEKGESYFVRFHFKPNKEKYLYTEEDKERANLDRDYAARDLYNAIENGNFPRWTLSVQVLNYEDIKKCEFDPFDLTKVLPEDKYKLRLVGTLVLDTNPTNNFAHSELAAYCPNNLVPGILGSPDKIFEARRLLYVDAQRYRLGANFHKIRVNCPHSKVFSYDRDGVPPVGYNGGGAPSYLANSYSGPIPYVDKNKPSLITIKQYEDSYNFKQVTERYNDMTIAERNRLVGNIVGDMGSLRLTDKRLQMNVINLFKLVHPDLSLRTMLALSVTPEEKTAKRK